MNSPLRLLIPTAIGAALGLGPSVLHAGGQPHEHGVTHLEVVADGSTLAINLRGAGYHLVGFEHAPEDEDQHAAWTDTRTRLADAAALFAPSPGARCRAEDARVEAPDGGDAVVEAGHGADDHAHAGSGHAGGHGHGSGHDHGHGHAHDESHAHGHDDDHHPHDHDHDDDHTHDHGGHTSDWSAHYRFSCEEPVRLEYIDIGLFDAFPAHEEVRYQRLSDNGQSGGTLTPGNTRLRMR